MLKKFRQQIHALGLFWLLIGIASLILASQMTRLVPITSTGVILMLSFAIIDVVCGVLACLKNMPAVIVGLVVSYISLAGTLIFFNICGLVIILTVILQAHRVLKWGSQLNARGIALTTKPADLPIK